jgi:hypothetical protein
MLKELRSLVQRIKKKLMEVMCHMRVVVRMDQLAIEEVSIAQERVCLESVFLGKLKTKCNLVVL